MCTECTRLSQVLKHVSVTVTLKQIQKRYRNSERERERERIPVIYHTHTHTLQSGKRYALTIAFTCDDTKAMTGEWDPQ